MAKKKANGEGNIRKRKDIASVLKLAKEQKLIYSNPAEACALPKVEHREMKTLPVEQLTSFLQEAKEP